MKLSRRFTTPLFLIAAAAVLFCGILTAQGFRRASADKRITDAARRAAARKEHRRKPKRKAGTDNRTVQGAVVTSLTDRTGSGGFQTEHHSASGAVEPAAEVSRFEAYDEPEEALKFYREKRLPEGETELPVERYFAAQERMRELPQYSTARGVTLPSRAEMAVTPGEQQLDAWTSLGPGNVGGRTRALLIHPQDPNVMYAAGVAGGVWKSTNGGGAWTPLADLLPNLAVTSMAFDPANPNTIYAGTGEGFFNADGVRSAGILKTTDGGMNWTRLAATATADFYYINDLVVSRNDPRRIYAATRSGVWRSTDSGENWTRVFSTSVQGGCLDLAVRTDQTTDTFSPRAAIFSRRRSFATRMLAAQAPGTAFIPKPEWGAPRWPSRRQIRAPSTRCRPAFRQALSIWTGCTPSFVQLRAAIRAAGRRAYATPVRRRSTPRFSQIR
ncbi:MAG TPA: hypothetical protein VNQ79_05495 [Blastocatellia bacterium]|nr:hypothetical protein [Blastocatellia bacterium]